MNAFTPSSAFNWLGSAFARPESQPTEMESSLSVRWNALHTLAEEIGAMAQLAKESETPELRGFSSMVERLSGDRQTLVHYGLSDLEAILSSGLDALGRLQAKGEDVTAPAVTLWCEFHRARQALLNLTEAV